MNLSPGPALPRHACPAPCGAWGGKGERGGRSRRRARQGRGTPRPPPQPLSLKPPPSPRLAATSTAARPPLCRRLHPASRRASSSHAHLLRVLARRLHARPPYPPPPSLMRVRVRVLVACGDGQEPDSKDRPPPRHRRIPMTAPWRPTTPSPRPRIGESENDGEFHNYFLFPPIIDSQNHPYKITSPGHSVLLFSAWYHLAAHCLQA